MKKFKKGLSVVAASVVMAATCCIPVFAEAESAPDSSLPLLPSTSAVESAPEESSTSVPDAAGVSIPEDSGPSESLPDSSLDAVEPESELPADSSMSESVPAAPPSESEVLAPVTSIADETAPPEEVEEVKNSVTITVLAEDEADTSGIAFTVTELDEKDFVDKGEVTEISQSVHKTKDGKLVLTNLSPNVYTFEAEPLEQYQPAYKVCLTVEEEGEFSDYLNLLLPEQHGDLEIKLNAAAGEQEVPDVVFFTITGEDFADNYAVSANAPEQLEGLKPGTYTVELDAIEGYETPPPQTVEVKDSESAALAFDAPKFVGMPSDEGVTAQAEDTRPGMLSVVAASNDGKTANVKFEVKGNGFEETGKTGKDGQLLLTGLEPGEYTVTQLPRKGYEIDAPKTLTVAHGETTCETFYNTKVDERGNLDIQLSAADAGSAFGVILNIKGEGFDSDVWTDHTGSKTVYNLKAGEYTITPKNADGTDLSTPQKAVVENGETTTVQIVK